MPIPELRGGKTSKPKKKKQTYTKKNFKSACTTITDEDSCRFPCVKKRNSQNMKKFHHCASKFSAKHDHMDLKTKRRIRGILSKLKKTAKKADKKIAKAKKSSKIAIKETRKADNHTKEAKEEESAFNGLFNSISDGLGIKSANTVKQEEPEPEPTQPEPEPETTQSEPTQSEPTQPEPTQPEPTLGSVEQSAPKPESQSTSVEDKKEEDKKEP